MFSDKGDFKTCFNIASNLTRIAVFANFKRGVLVAEILEGVFSQVGPIFDQYSIPEEDKEQTKDRIREHIIALSSAYNGADKAGLYDIVENLRFTATDFQFKCWNQWKRIKSKDPSRISRGGDF